MTIAALLVRHIAGEVPADKTMPGGAVLRLELLLQVRRDVLLRLQSTLLSCDKEQQAFQDGRPQKLLRMWQTKRNYKVTLKMPLSLVSNFGKLSSSRDASG